MDFYKGQEEFVQTTAEQVLSLLSRSSELEPLIHSIKARAKSLKSMRKKLVRKFKDARLEGTKFVIDRASFFRVINDSAGLRILHINTLQFPKIHKVLLALFERSGYPLLEDPSARTWDVQYDKYFRENGIKTKQSESYYTSVHYVIGLNEQIGCSAEIQVRTVAEEVWGEVDHAINYPEDVKDLACAEQLKVLGRAISTCTRLVDSIYRSHSAFKDRAARSASSRKGARAGPVAASKAKVVGAKKKWSKKSTGSRKQKTSVSSGAIKKRGTKQERSEN